MLGPGASTEMVRTESGQSKWTKTAKAELEVRRPFSSASAAAGLSGRADSLNLTNSKDAGPKVAVALASPAAESAQTGSSQGAEAPERRQDAPAGLPGHESPSVHDDAVPDSTALVQEHIQAQGGALNGFNPSSANGKFVSTGYGAPAGAASGAPVQQKTESALLASAGGTTPAVRGQMPDRSFARGSSGGGARLIPGSNPNRQASATGAGTLGSGQSAFLGGAAAGSGSPAGAGGSGARSAFEQAGAAGKGGGNALQFPGGGSGGAERGDMFGSGSSGKSGDRPVSPATKTQLKNQAKAHYDAAATYRTGVALPMLNRQRASATAQAAALKVQSLALKSLETAVDKKIKEFSDLPEARSLLVDTKHSIGGKDGLRARLDSAVKDMADGAVKAKYLPNNCTMKQTVTQKVWVPNIFGGGRYENKQVTTEYRTLSLAGQDLMDAGLRRAKNVGIEAKAGADMTGAAFGPVIDGLRAHPDPKQAARAGSLEGIAIRIQNDLDSISSKMPGAIARVGSVAGKQTPHKTVQTAALAGVRKFKELNSQISEKGPGYPEIPAKPAVFRAMTETLLYSENALITINGMNGSVNDSLDALHASGQNATKAYVAVCDSYHDLKALEAKAKK